MRIDDLREIAIDSKASQDEWEMFQVLRHVDEIQPKVIVEIGVDGGGSMRTWREAFSPKLLIGIDINEAKREELLDLNVVYADSIKESTIEALKRVLGGREIDFLFIDGDHHYEAVKREFQLYMPLVRKGGIVGFHDTNKRGFEWVQVDQFMRELDKSHSYRTADYFSGINTPGTRVLWK